MVFSFLRRIIAEWTTKAEKKLTWSYSQRAVSGRETRILSILPPVLRPNVVPRS